MSYRLDWLQRVLADAGLKTAEVDGWQTRGLGDAGEPKGVMCHHTGGPLTGNMPSLGIIVQGRPDLRGPLSQLALGRDGTFYIVAAGRAQHAGAGTWQDIAGGNTNFIGIEAENAGRVDARGKPIDPWPAVQMDAYRRGVAAILRFIGANSIMACGHKEFAQPVGRKDDPLFDMDAFRRNVTALMTTDAKPDLIPAIDVKARATLRRGATGDAVKQLQQKLGEPVDGVFGGHTEAAVRAAQAKAGLVPDGIVGPKTWSALFD